MGSLFINAGIVAGVGLAALPVILHLFMKQTPKRVIFPALRLIKERQKRSRKKLKVKNWLLLLARMGLLALMALALARPRVAVTASLGTGEEPTALAFVFDTSLSMGYTELGKSRLAEAKERAAEVLKKMNEQSQVYIVDGADPAQPIAQSPSAARKKLDGLAIRAVNRPLNAAIGAAYAAVAGSELLRREVYVLTDLAASQWQVGQEVEGLGEALKAIKGGNLDTFLLRVGAKEARDVAIVSADLGAPVATEDDPIVVKAKVRNAGPQTHRIVELMVDGIRRGTYPISLPPGAELDVPPMKTPKLPAGLHRLEVGLAGEPDPLPFDDRRYLTVEVQPPMRVLVIADEWIDLEFLADALDPRDLPEGESRPFQVERVTTAELDKLAGKPLKAYAGIFLSNVRRLDESWWNKLYAYVRDGGGLVLAPAGLAEVENYNTGAAGQFLPARIGKVRDHAGVDPPFAFGKPDLGHPIFAANQKDLIAELALPPIYKTREVTPEGKSRVILSYVDDTPALIERDVAGAGASPGKVLLWTTALARRPEADEAQAWNEFPLKGWSFLAVTFQTAYYLAGAAGERLVFDAGEDATLALDPSRQFRAFAVQGPNARSGETRGDPGPGGTLLVPSPGDIGQWTVTASAKDGPDRKLGFSVNPPRGEIALATLGKGDLDTLFGKGKYQIADDAASLKRVQGRSRQGVELFPWIMAAILALVTLENLLANTFYREKAPGPAPVRA